MAADDVRFRIHGTTYDTATVDQISLRDVVTFNAQAAEIGLGVTWNDVERISSEMAGMKKSDDPHPEALVMFAVTVWAARRIAGEDISLGEALDVPMVDIEVIEAPKGPKDHQPKKAKKASKSARASALAAVPPADEDSTTPPTSSEQSESA